MRSIGSPLQPDFCHRHAGHSQPSIAVHVCGRCGHGTDERNLGRLDLSGLWGHCSTRARGDSRFCCFPLAVTQGHKDTRKDIRVWGIWSMIFSRQVAATVLQLYTVTPYARNSMTPKRPRRKQQARRSS